MQAVKGLGCEFRSAVGCQSCTHSFHRMCSSFRKLKTQQNIAALGDFKKTAFVPYSSLVAYATSESIAKTAAAAMSYCTLKKVRVFDFDFAYSWLTVQGLHGADGQEPEYLLDKVLYLDLTRKINMKQESAASIVTSFLLVMQDLKVPTVVCVGLHLLFYKDALDNITKINPKC